MSELWNSQHSTDGRTYFLIFVLVSFEPTNSKWHKMWCCHLSVMKTFTIGDTIQYHVQNILSLISINSRVREGSHNVLHRVAQGGIIENTSMGNNNH
jgi:hypothetical protein